MSALSVTTLGDHDAIFRKSLLWGHTRATHHGWFLQLQWLTVLLTQEGSWVLGWHQLAGWLFHSGMIFMLVSPTT